MSEKKGMTDLQIELAFDKFVANMEGQAKKSVRAAGNVYAEALKRNAPRNKNPVESGGIYTDTRHSADNIILSRLDNTSGRPSIDVGFKLDKGLGWYMHFPDGGTVVRGTLHQPAQNFMEKTDRETVGIIQKLYRDAIKKGAK